MVDLCLNWSRGTPLLELFRCLGGPSVLFFIDVRCQLCTKYVAHEQSLFIRVVKIHDRKIAFWMRNMSDFNAF